MQQSGNGKLADGYEDENSNFYTIEHLRRTLHYTPPRKKKLSKQLLAKLSCDKLTIFRILPILSWLPKYNFKNDFMGDIIGGITVAILQIPQSLAFAPLALQQPVIGLYMATYPSLVYMFFGTSPHLSVGMFAVSMLMTRTIVEEFSIPDEDIMNGISGYSKHEVAIAVSFTIGIIQLLFGLLQLGFVSVILSNNLITAFTSGVAYHVLFLQFKHIFGVDVTSPPGPFKLPRTAYSFFSNVADTNYIALALGVLSMAFLYVCLDYLKPLLAKKTKILIPYELILIALVTGVSIAFDLAASHNVEVVGNVPSGLPLPKIPPLALIPHIIPDCFAIAIVGMSVNISMATATAKLGGYVVDNNQEMRAIGVCNVISSFFHCAPATGSISRTILQFSAGAKTQLSHGVSGLSILFTLLFLGFCFEQTPLTSLATITLMVIRGILLKVTEFPKVWRTSWTDGLIWITTFVSVLLLDGVYGLGVGVIASIFVLIFNGIKSDVQLFVHSPTILYNLNSRYYSNHASDSRLCILKIVGNLNFVNFVDVDKQIRSHVDSFLKKVPPDDSLVSVVLDFTCVPYIDPTIANNLSILHSALTSNRCIVILSNISIKCYETLDRRGVFTSIDKNLAVVSVEDAISLFKRKLEE